MIWSNADGVFSLYHFNDGVVENESLAMAVAGATGVSRGTVFVSHSLLFAADTRIAFSEISEPSADIRQVFGTRAHHIIGRTSDTHTDEMWITTDFVLRKTREHITITAEFQRECMEDLKKGHPELHREAKHGGRKFADRHYVRERQYRSVVFDMPIDEQVFYPSFDR